MLSAGKLKAAATWRCSRLSYDNNSLLVDKTPFDETVTANAVPQQNKDSFLFCFARPRCRFLRHFARLSVTNGWLPVHHWQLTLRVRKTHTNESAIQNDWLPVGSSLFLHSFCYRCFGSNYRHDCCGRNYSSTLDFKRWLRDSRPWKFLRQFAGG